MLCVALQTAILKEKMDDQLEKFIRSTSPERLMGENDAHMVGRVALQCIRGQQSTPVNANTADQNTTMI